jgi:cytochrome c oxidase cbb3-type subunit 4
MDIGTLRGISTLFLMLTFIGLVFWVYSGKRKKEYEDAGNLPFADEQPGPSPAHEPALKQGVEDE